MIQQLDQALALERQDLVRAIQILDQQRSPDQAEVFTDLSAEHQLGLPPELP